MISLAYELGPAAGQLELDDWSGVDEIGLRYHAFLGDVRMVVEGVDFSTRWGWVTILDFAVSLRRSAESLRSASSARVDFTESDAEVRFTRSGSRVDVEASYVGGSASVDLDEFIAASEEFLAETIAELCAMFPGLDRNAFVVREIG